MLLACFLVGLREALAGLRFGPSLVSRTTPEYRPSLLACLVSASTLLLLRPLLLSALMFGENIEERVKSKRIPYHNTWDTCDT